MSGVILTGSGWAVSNHLTVCRERASAVEVRRSRYPDADITSVVRAKR